MIRPGQWSFDFMGQRRATLSASLLLLLVSVAALSVRGLDLGIDFTGGTLVEVTMAPDTETQQVRTLLERNGYTGASVQSFGALGELLIRLPPQPQQAERARLGERLLAVLQRNDDAATMRRIEFVGPRVGEELAQGGALAMLITLGCILVYVALRFQMRFSVGAIAALSHDVVIMLGFFALTGLDFDLSVLAALLAVVGYSLNDTIVIFDRIRENFRRMHKAGPVEVINYSLNRTLGRTLTTSFTTLLVLLALLTLGGEAIRPFSLALIVGVLVGTYSSLYIASPTILALGVSRRDLLPVEKPESREGAQL